jgi:hypothetical protein
MAKTQMLSFPIRLPDCMQAEALRLLDESRPAINTIIEDLWPLLDEFAAERTGIAWKQVEQHLVARSGHGSRQERCEMEQAGRILRAQATRKQVFQTILPLLTDELIKPAEGRRNTRKAVGRVAARTNASGFAKPNLDTVDTTITGTLPRQSPPCPSSHYRRVHRPALPVRVETDASPSLLDGGPSARGVLPDPPFVAGCTPMSHRGSTVCGSAGDWVQR